MTNGFRDVIIDVYYNTIRKPFTFLGTLSCAAHYSEQNEHNERDKRRKQYEDRNNKGKKISSENEKYRHQASELYHSVFI